MIRQNTLYSRSSLKYNFYYEHAYLKTRALVVFHEYDILPVGDFRSSHICWYHDNVCLESGAENTQMKTLLDALWWCIATVTTVGYGDVVPVTSLGRIMAIVYMFFGITLIAILLAVISNNFYSKRMKKKKVRRRNKRQII